MSIRRNKLIGYILMATASAGFYGYYLKTNELIWPWIVCFAVGLTLLVMTNNVIYKKFHSKLVYYDILFCAFVWLIPLIRAPHGISIAVMMVISIAYAFSMSSHESKIFSQT